uniref:KH type-2 domain-containing protein n=2 Tax=Chaetoceros debilis TaxID=122233 RepID=A0A7S3V7L9_9STRA
MSPPSTHNRKGTCHLIHQYRSPLNAPVHTRAAVIFLLCVCTLLSVTDAFVIGKNLVRHESVVNTGDAFILRAEEKDTASNFPSIPQVVEYEGRILAPHEDFRCGFVSLIGAPNMGKSTLLNAILKETLCSATNRPQTTRHSILGVLTSDEQKCQLCFHDTPGVIDDPAYKLQEGMMEAVQGAFRDSDVILVITDMFSTPIPDDELFHKLNLSNKKKIVVINKVDLADKVSADPKQSPQFHMSRDNDAEPQYRRTVTVEDAVSNWRGLVPDAVAIIPMTASNGGDNAGVDALRTLLLGGEDVPKAFRALGRPIPGMFQEGVKFINDDAARELIPCGPPLYDPETLTDRTERFFASEIIRATLFTKLGKELPYCCEVRIEQFREPRPEDKKQIVRINATICVERDSQKGIVVGKGGVKIKEVGVEARQELENFLQGKVHLDLNVKVEKNWRRDEKKLKEYGYLKN